MTPRLTVGVVQSCETTMIQRFREILNFKEKYLLRFLRISLFHENTDKACKICINSEVAPILEDFTILDFKINFLTRPITYRNVNLNKINK